MRALVTGGAKRLGREISVYLANRGYDVAVHYNSSENEALDVAKEINSQGRLSECLKCDLLIEDQVKALVPLASEALGGPISMLVNNASIFEQLQKCLVLIVQPCAVLHLSSTLFHR